MKINVSIKFTEQLLASSPCNPEVYKQFILRQREVEAAKAIGKKDPAPLITPDKVVEEMETLTNREESGWSVFHVDNNGLFMFDYHVRGFMKEAASCITGKALTAYRSKIDKWLFVNPRRIYFMRDENYIKAPDGVCERPIRAMTMQGPRISLKRSDMLQEGVVVKFELEILPLGMKELTEEVLESWLHYGKYSGFGEWRTGSNGRFDLVSFKTVK
jgi:hypothetical protein